MDEGGWVFIPLTVGLVLGLSAGIWDTNNIWHEYTVERGLAIYCPQNGQWAWIGECEAEGRGDE